ncbi:unnamed protein product [Closterium sp. NIES-65]|nr:unnamed protein product [Closterium sp. NIES-65]
MSSSPQPPHPAAPDTRGVGPARRTAASNTSPRALRAARRGKESQPHEQQREELVGRVGITTPGEAAGEQESVEGEAAAAAAAGGSGAMGTESEAAVAVEAAAAAGLEKVAAEATEMVAAAELGGPDAASGGGSASPSAIPQAWQPEEPGPPVAQEWTEAVELAASPEPVTASVLAAAVTVATGEQDGARTEEGAPFAAANAETSAAAKGASTQGHDLGGSGRQGRGAGGTAGAARGKTKLRAQPAPRRPVAGLGLGPPGPLLGWLLQGQLPQGQERHLPSVGTSDGRREAGDMIRLAPTPIITTGNAVAGPSMQQPPRRDSRNSTGGEQPRLPPRLNRPHGVKPAVLRGRKALRGASQGLARQRRCWRRGSRREDRNRQAEASRTPALGGEKRLAEQGEECEGPEGGGPEEAQLSAEGSRSSPSDLADDSAIWKLAATWDKYPLQKGDQPFVVRRMPPKILESYTLCLLAPLI